VYYDWFGESRRHVPKNKGRTWGMTIQIQGLAAGGPLKASIRRKKKVLKKKKM